MPGGKRGLVASSAAGFRSLGRADERQWYGVMRFGWFEGRSNGSRHGQQKQCQQEMQSQRECLRSCDGHAFEGAIEYPASKSK